MIVLKIQVVFKFAYLGSPMKIATFEPRLEKESRIGGAFKIVVLV